MSGLSIWHWLFVLIVVALPLYFVPSIMAYVRHHQNRLAILLMNIFLGWTFLGWVAALIWAATHVERGLLGAPPAGIRREPIFSDRTGQQEKRSP